MLTFKRKSVLPKSPGSCAGMILGKAGRLQSTLHTLIKKQGIGRGCLQAATRPKFPIKKLWRREPVLNLKFDKDIFMSYPLLSSLFVMDFSLLLFTPLIRFPIIISIVLVFGLVYLSMFFGVKLNDTQSAK